MKKIFLSLIIVNNIFATSFTPAFQGGVNGGGADYGEDDQSAWFLKGYKDFVDICVQKSDNFLVENEKIEKIIKNSYKIWDQYITDKNIYEDETNGDFDPELVKLQNNIKIRFLKKCENSDLVLFLGLQNEEVSKAISKFNNPVAITHKQEANMKNGWSKGFIWIDAMRPWDDNKNLEMILLHEIGHTLGNGHKDATIMRKDIAHYISYSSDDYPDLSIKYKESVDWENKFITCYECMFNDGSLWIKGSEHERIVLEKFLNKKIKDGDTITSKFNIFKGEARDKNIFGKYFLKINAQEFEYEIKFKIRNLTLQQKTVSIFQRTRTIQKGEENSIFYSDDVIEIAYLLGEIDLGHKKTSFIIENNLMSNTFVPPIGEKIDEQKLFWNPTGVSAYVVEGGERYYLFSRITEYNFEENKKMKNNPLKK